MKTIGLIGGMSWESTVGYYRMINEGVKKSLGGLHSAKIILHSVDFDPIQKLQHKGDWDGTAKILSAAAAGLQAAGADFFLICTNTMHKVAPQVKKAVEIPLLHIADATAEYFAGKGMKTVGLLGTAFTMEDDFYKGILTENYGLNVLVPDDTGRKIVHNVIYGELCLGQFMESSKDKYLRIIEHLSSQGAEAVILGCTEIGMLVNQTDTHVELCDTTAVHAATAVEYAI
jgi:aspartate racemase